MHRTILALMCAATGFAPGVRAADHLVSSEALRARLVESAASREQDLETLERLLSSPEAAPILGVDLARARIGLARLGDREARDLATRARSLGSDPAAGLTGSTDDLLVVLLVVLIVLLVLKGI